MACANVVQTPTEGLRDIKMTENDFSARLVQAIKDHCWTLEDAARIANTDTFHVERWIEGRSLPTEYVQRTVLDAVRPTKG